MTTFVFLILLRYLEKSLLFLSNTVLFKSHDSRDFLDVFSRLNHEKLISLNVWD